MATTSAGARHADDGQARARLALQCHQRAAIGADAERRHVPDLRHGAHRLRALLAKQATALPALAHKEGGAFLALAAQPVQRWHDLVLQPQAAAEAFAQHQQLRPERVAARGGALHEAMALQGAEQPERGGQVQPGPAGDLGQRQRRVPVLESLQDGQRAIHGTHIALRFRGLARRGLGGRLRRVGAFPRHAVPFSPDFHAMEVTCAQWMTDDTPGRVKGR